MEYEHLLFKSQFKRCFHQAAVSRSLWYWLNCHVPPVSAQSELQNVALAISAIKKKTFIVNPDSLMWITEKCWMTSAFSVIM